MKKKNVKTMQKSKFVGYARVSTDMQDTDNQKQAINSFLIENNISNELDELVTETISSSKKERKIFELVESLNNNDVLIVFENSRLARSTLELLQILESIKQKKASLYIIQHGTKPVIENGRLDLNIETLLTMQGMFARMEKEMIRSRVRNALRQKKIHGTKTGKPLGKPPTININIKQIAGLRGKGFSWDYIKENYGVSRALYYYHKNKNKINQERALIREHL